MPEPTPDYVSVDEFAQFLGVRPRVVRRALRLPVSPLPHVKIGGTIRIHVPSALASISK